MLYPLVFKTTGAESLKGIVATLKSADAQMARQLENDPGCSAKIWLEKMREFVGDLIQRAREARAGKTKTSEPWLLISAQAQSPYDGCFWEWNYWLLTADFQTLYPLYVSHRTWKCYECGGTDRAAKSVRQFLIEELLHAGNYPAWEDWDVRIVTDTTDLSDTDKCYIHPNCLPTCFANFEQVAHELQRYNMPFFWKCGACEKLVEGEPHSHHGDSHGNGGVGVVFDEAYCEECLANGCTSCGYPERLDKAHRYLDEETAAEFDKEAGAYCEDCFPEERCYVCRSSIKIDELDHGLCETCKSEVLTNFKEAYERGDPDAPPTKICPKCRRVYESSPHPDYCDVCWKEEMGYE